MVVFSRDPAEARQAVPGAAEYVGLGTGRERPVGGAVDGAYAVIRPGRGVNRGQALDPGVQARDLATAGCMGTRGAGGRRCAAPNKPQVFINGSAIGYYGFRDDDQAGRERAPGSDFLARVVKAWEAEAAKAEALGMRMVLVRTGIVLDEQEGSLPQMMLPFRLFAGGPVLPGTRYLPWVHLRRRGRA